MESDSGDELTRSRHRRSAERGSGEPTTALPSWAQRHLDEAGTPAPAPTVTSRHRRAGRGGADSPLRGWGVAVLSVAAAVTAVPLAINAVANDRSDDPLPKVDTFTAGAPQALDGAQSGTRRGATDVGDPTGGVLTVPGVAPGAPQVAPAPVVVPAPQPAAVVRPTTPPAPTRITPRSAAPTTTTGSTTPTTTSGDDNGEGRSTTPKPRPTSSGSSGSSGSGSSGGGQKQDKGLLGNTVDAVGGVVGGVGGVAKGLL